MSKYRFFENTKKYLRQLDISYDPKIILDKYGKKGVELLKNATPEDTGKTADRWNYILVDKRNGDYDIVFTNDKKDENGTPIIILLHYGHATRGGSWVEGIDFINPSLKIIFDQLVDDLWKEVSSI